MGGVGWRRERGNIVPVVSSCMSDNLTAKMWEGGHREQVSPGEPTTPQPCVSSHSTD